MNGQPRTPGRKSFLKKVPGLAFTLVLAAGVGLAVRNPAGLSSPGPAKLLNGEWSGAYARRFEKHLAIREPAVAAWALLRYGLFAEGNRGVLVGTEGWLFSAEEFQGAREREASLRVDLAAVREVREELAGRGVRLLIALVPAKARVYPEHLGRYMLPEELSERYRRQRDLLSGLGIPVPDLLAALLEAKGRGPVFLRTDTHWTALGAGAAAEALSGAVEGFLREAGSPRVGFQSADGPRREYRGDLLNFLPLGRFASRVGPKPDSLLPRVTAAAQSLEAGLFDAVAIPVVLVGTSYSAGELWNLEGALKTAAGADVLNVSKQGQGALAPMRELLASPVLEEVQADVVVWEIPERYFVLP